MKQTGQNFDMNPETFTLANVFAMELHRYTETIGEIVVSASKELGIEKVGTFEFIFCTCSGFLKYIGPAGPDGRKSYGPTKCLF